MRRFDVDAAEAALGNFADPEHAARVELKIEDIEQAARRLLRQGEEEDMEFFTYYPAPPPVFGTFSVEHVPDPRTPTEMPALRRTIFQKRAEAPPVEVPAWAGPLLDDPDVSDLRKVEMLVAGASARVILAVANRVGVHEPTAGHARAVLRQRVCVPAVTGFAGNTSKILRAFRDLV